MNNHAARRALTGLAHPLTIGAVALLFVNDFILRRLAPVWLTGKLGDAAWLVFAPLVVATVLAWVVPPHLPRQERIVGGLAVGLAGLSFALVKGIPATHDAAMRVVEAVTGAPSHLIADPTDLLVLPALLISWCIWQASEARHSRLPRFGLTVLTLAALATMADASAPDEGVTCLDAQPDGSLIAHLSWGGFENYVSRDGGLSWERDESEPSTSSCPTPTHPYDESWEFKPDDGGEIVYRFAAGVGIDRSADGGETWTREVDLSASEADGAYRQRLDGDYTAQIRPEAAIVDPATGNLVVAMGNDGMLTRTANGEWHWAAVGRYHLARMDSSGQMLNLISGELILAGVLAALALGTLSLLGRKVHWLVRVLQAVSWLVWLGAVLLQPAWILDPSGYGQPIIFGILGANVVIGVTWLAVGIVQLARQHSGWWQLVLTALLATVLFALPYILWATGSTPSYSTAEIFALLLTLATVTGGGWWVRRERHRETSSPPPMPA